MHIQKTFNKDELEIAVSRETELINTTDNDSKTIAPLFVSCRKLSVISISSLTSLGNTNDHAPLISDNNFNSINTTLSDVAIKNQDEKFIKTPKDLLVIICMALLFFTATLNVSMMSPFFTPVAESKGVGETLVGFIFAIYPLFVFLCSPLAGKWTPVVGAKFCLFAGSFLEGGSLILFGFVIDMPSTVTFTVFCFLIRIVTAMGTAFAEVASFTILSMQYKKRLNTVFGILELFSGLGLMSGPALGGIIYKFGGFRLPFLISGGINIFVMFVIYWILPSYQGGSEEDDEGNENNNLSVLSTLSIPGVLAIAIVTVSSGISISFIEPILTNQLQDITNNGLTIDQVGFIFLISPGVYTFASPVLGALMDTKINGRYAIIAGHFMAAACFMFLGPSPLFESFIEPHLWLVCLSLGVLGLSDVTFVIPALDQMRIAARRRGLPDNVTTNSMLSGIFNGFFSIGCVLGPTLSGFLTEHLSFAWACSILAMCLFTEGVILILFTLWEKSIKTVGLV